RAAALIPNAFDVMKTSNLFGENAIQWLIHNRTHDEVEDSLNGYPGTRKGTSYQNPDSANLDEWHDRDDPPAFSGQVDPPQNDDEEIEDVILTFKGPGNVEHEDHAVPNPDTGNWSSIASTQNFVVPGNDKMTIFESGNNVGEINSYYDEWDFEVDRGTINVIGVGGTRESGANGTTSGTTVSAYRHYKKKRKKDTLYGFVNLDFSLPLYGYDENTHATNDDPSSAEIERVPTGYDKVIRRFTGSLWRYEFGRRRGTWNQERLFADGISNGPSQQITSLGDRFPSPGDPYSGDIWVDGSWDPKEANPNDPTGRTFSDEFPYKSNTVDRYEIRTDKDEYPIYQGQQFEVDWGNTLDSVWKESLSDRYKDEADQNNPNPFFVALNDSVNALVPSSSTASSYFYTAPGDGFLDIKTVLRPVLEKDEDGNDLSLTEQPNDMRLNYLLGGELPYDFEVTIFGPHRVALVDPLMCSQIEYVAAEWALANNQPITAHPLYERIRKAAEFYQYSSVAGQTVPFVMRRMNWNIVANQTGATPVLAASRKLAVAESLCRPADVLQVELPDDPLAASEPRYEVGVVSADNNAPVYIQDNQTYCSQTNQPCSTKQIPLRRQVDDRLSWMLTIQPEGDGTIPATWRAGNYFDVAIVVFQNRLLPPVGATTIEGENFFDSWWNEETGFLTLAVNQSSGIDQDDIRKMFAAGNFVMVAPKKANFNQSIDWLEIQNSEFTRLADKTIVEIIPTAEPVTNTNIGSQDFSAGEPANLVTLVYQGVVAVSRHSVQITE
ncbi:MAG: hypothetical protein ACR2NF_09890, partial [Pirellulales bacterium]